MDKRAGRLYLPSHSGDPPRLGFASKGLQNGLTSASWVELSSHHHLHPEYPASAHGLHLNLQGLRVSSQAHTAPGNLNLMWRNSNKILKRVLVSREKGTGRSIKQRLDQVQETVTEALFLSERYHGQVEALGEIRPLSIQARNFHRGTHLLTSYHIFAGTETCYPWPACSPCLS